MKRIFITWALMISSLSFSTQAAMTDWIDFRIDNGHITIPVAIKGIEGRAILDTGAQVHSINKRFITEQKFEFSRGKKIRLSGVYGVEQVRMYDNVPTRLFDMELKLNDLIPAYLGEPEYQILLGAQLFRMFVFQIDYPNQRMRLIDREAIDVADFENIKMKTDRRSGFPIVRVNLNNEQNGWFILDTGNAGGIFLQRSIAERHGWLDRYNATNTFSTGAVKAASTNTFSLPSLTFGPFELEDIIVSVPASGEKENVSKRYETIGSRIKGEHIRGLLGYDVLKHFVLTIDYRGGHLHIGLPEGT